jgi:hypothetical protein
MTGSPMALFRLMKVPKALGFGGFLAFLLVHAALTREGSVSFPSVSMPEGAPLWLAFFNLSIVAGALVASWVGKALRGCLMAPSLPGLEAGLRRGIGWLALGLGAGAGVTAVVLGQGAAEALALAAFTGSVFLLLAFLTVWIERAGVHDAWSMALLGPLFLAWVLLPTVPARLGTAQPLATVVVGLALAGVLLRHFPLLVTPLRGGSGARGDLRGASATGRGAVRIPAPTVSPPAPLPPGAWVDAPVRAGLRFSWLEIRRGGAGGAILIGLQTFLAFLWVAFAVRGGNWLLLPLPLMVFRIGPFPAPIGSFTLPVGREARARIAWAAELLQAWALVAVLGGILVLAFLWDPERLAAVSGPHPALVLGALAAALPLNGALDAALGVRAPARGEGAFKVELALGRRLLSRGVAAVLALGLALALAIADVIGPGALALALTFGFLPTASLVAALALLLFRRHLARCPLGPGM